MFRELTYPVINDILKFFALALSEYHEVVLFHHCVLFDIAESIHKIQIKSILKKNAYNKICYIDKNGFFIGDDIYYVFFLSNKRKKLTSTCCSTTVLLLQTSRKVSVALVMFEQ